MKALSIRQPWVWAILYAGKRVENRKRRTHYRGPILIHASQGMTWDEYNDGIAYIRSATASPVCAYRWLQTPAFEDLARGAIVGSAMIADCVDSQPLDTQQAQWWTGPFGWVLADVRRFAKPIPCKGALGLWNVPPEVEAEVRRGA